MRVVRPTRSEAVAAGVSVVCAAFFLAAEGAVALLTALVLAPVVVAYRRRPVLAALGVAAVGVVHHWVLGVSVENPALVAAYFVVVYALGRYATVTRGVIALLVLLVESVAPDPTVPTLVFSCILLGSVWAFGYVVRRRSDAARRATATAAELAALDPAVRAQQIVAQERARLAGDALAVVHRAVLAMHRHATAGEETLDSDALTAIQAEGRRATSDLRRLLGLLRSERDPEGEAAPPETASPRRGWWAEVGIAVALVAFTVLEITISPEPAGGLALLLAALLAASVVLRRTDPALACVAAVLPPALALVLGVALPIGVWVAAVVALVAWPIMTDGRVRGYAALGAFLAVLLVAVNQDHPGNEAMLLAIAVLAATAGHLWAARGREQRSATAVAARLRAEHDTIAERAVRAERLRLARELHDVASHAVGVIVLQAGAAAALREQDPDRAREAVRTAQAAAGQALGELDVLFGLLEAGAVGASGFAAGTPRGRLSDRLKELAERMRQAGLHVRLHLGPGLPDSADLAATVYRVVQEALTNAIRYAPEATVDVTITEDAGMLEVCVRDDGPHAASAMATGSGYGLVGLAERVHAHDGRLTAAPQPDGGFVVSARLPITRQLEANP